MTRSVQRRRPIGPPWWRVLVDSYVRDACYANKMPPAPPPVAALLARVERRSHRMLLAERTEVVGGERRFTRGNRYTDLPKKLARAAREAFARYAARVHTGAAREAFDVLDVAFRIAYGESRKASRRRFDAWQGRS